MPARVPLAPPARLAAATGEKPMYQNIAILGAFIFIYSLASKGLKRTPFHGAILFTAFGLLFGGGGLQLLSPSLDPEGMGAIAELTLALVLFTDAANADLGVLRKSFHIPQRLLLIGLPITIVLGFGVGSLIFHNGLTLLEIALLATILAPTDAALGKAVVKDKSVPPDIREGLNVESGLNDGICVPILFIFLTLATDTERHGGTLLLAVESIAREIGVGLAVGAGLTFLGTRLISYFSGKGWITETWQQLPVVALAGVCYSLAQSLGGSGFIATFVGGLFFGALATRQQTRIALVGRGRWRHPGAGHLGGLRRGGDRPVCGAPHLAGGALCGTEPYGYKNAAGVFVPVRPGAAA